MKRWLAAGGIIFASLIGVGLYIDRVVLGPPLITIHNNSATTLHSVGVSGRGFSLAIPMIEPSMSTTVRVRPAGESDLSLSFDASGKRVSKGDLAYIGASGGYRVYVEVDPEFDVTAKESLALQNLTKFFSSAL